MNRQEFDRRVKARGNGPGLGTCLDRFSLLNEQQRATVRDFLELCLVDSDDVFGRDLQAALNNYWSSPVHKRHRDEMQRATCGSPLKTNRLTTETQRVFLIPTVHGAL